MNLISRHKIISIASSFFLLSLILFIYWFLFIPPSQTFLTKVIMIKKGMNLRKISTILEQEGIIKNKELFIGMANLLGKRAEIKAGEYEFHTHMLPLEVLDTLVKGQVKRHLVTIPEGYTLSQIAQLLEDLNIVGKKTFIQKATSPTFISSLDLSNTAMAGKISTLEGYLFPDTYHLIREMDPAEIIQMMVYKFNKVFGQDLAIRASQMGVSQREAIVLASIIEKETPLSKERPLVSAVFHNRLKRNIPLQSDPTVIYGIKDFDGNLTKAHLLKPTPYNTYISPGLPPTPICNPGKESILAALYPAPVPYLYFVSKNDGSHYFSVDIEEHNRAVWKYQKMVIPRKNDLTKK
jgi:UPF0755 protein